MTTEPLTRLVRHLKQSLDAADLAEWADAELLAKFRESREPAVLEVIVRLVSSSASKAIICRRRKSSCSVRSRAAHAAADAEVLDKQRKS